MEKKVFTVLSKDNMGDYYIKRGHCDCRFSLSTNYYYFIKK